LYLLPGFSVPAELYCLLVWLLRDDFRCVTVEPDWQGSGKDDRRLQPRTMRDYADMLLAVADDLGDDTVMLFGAEFGAAWSLAAAFQAPRRIARLILLQGFVRRKLTLFEQGLAWACRLSRRSLAEFPYRDAVQTRNHRQWFPPFDQSRWRYFLEATGQMPLRELSRRALAVARFDGREDARQISVPTLLVQTEGDGQLAQGCQAELEGLLPNVRVESLSNTGALAYLTHPHRLAKLIRANCREPVAPAVSPG
jgi:pimeloyl-ACP methyl ester carboxylesterase